MTTKRWMTAAVLVLALVGCGGKVLVDGLPQGEGGAGGASSSSGQDGGLSCGNTTVPSNLMGCSASAGSGTGGPIMCQTNWCNGNDTYSAKCQGNTCSCQLNGAEKCTCALNGAGTFCTVGVTDCCPWGKTK